MTWSLLQQKADVRVNEEMGFTVLDEVCARGLDFGQPWAGNGVAVRPRVHRKG